MTASATTRPAAASGGIGSMLRDGLIVMWRNLKRIPRIPELAVFGVLQSIMFVVLFSVIFGGAIPIPGGTKDSATFRSAPVSNATPCSPALDA